MERFKDFTKNNMQNKENISESKSIFRSVRMIDCSDWDKLVEETYKRPYTFQQQDGCQSRGIVSISIPDEDNDDEMNDSIPEIVNGNTIGVKFAAWLERDPKQPLKDEKDTYDWLIGMFWERSFYPDLQTVANDLHKKGLIEAGEYSINIDW